MITKNRVADVTKTIYIPSFKDFFRDPLRYDIVYSGLLGWSLSNGDVSLVIKDSQAQYLISYYKRMTLI